MAEFSADISPGYNGKDLIATAIVADEPTEPLRGQRKAENMPGHLCGRMIERMGNIRIHGGAVLKDVRFLSVSKSWRGSSRKLCVTENVTIIILGLDFGLGMEGQA